MALFRLWVFIDITSDQARQMVIRCARQNLADDIRVGFHAEKYAFMGHSIPYKVFTQEFWNIWAFYSGESQS